jgi:endonuclease/exonuclease/phosphatase family metal-dependent hydrolase
MYDFDILGVQEPYKPQIDELMEFHGNVYDYFVVHTGNINSRGESHSNPIFYRKDRFSLLSSGVFWFSENPDSVGSVSWSASQARNCIWVQLYDRKSGTDFYVFNSHFDHKSVMARDNSAQLLVAKVRQIAGNKLAICTGDFNTKQTTPAFTSLSTGILMDTYAIAQRKENDEYRTSHGYRVIPPEPGSGRIDHIFITRKFKSKKIIQWKICNETFDGNWASDHYPVFIDLRLN